MLNSLPIYYFSIFKAPSGVNDKLERIMRKFLWGGNNSNNKICWIAWDKMMAQKTFGGLGLGSLKAYNIALITKWKWKLKVYANAMLAIHKSNRIWKFFPCKEEICCVWKDILKVNLDYISLNINVQELFKKCWFVVIKPHFGMILGLTSARLLGNTYFYTS